MMMMMIMIMMMMMMMQTLILILVMVMMTMTMINRITTNAQMNGNLSNLMIRQRVGRYIEPGIFTSVY